MAEPYRPVGEASDDPGRPAAHAVGDQPSTTPPVDEEEDVAFLQPPADEPEDEEPTRRAEPAAATVVQPTPAEEAAPVRSSAADQHPVPPAPREHESTLAPAAEDAPAPPKKRSNRLVATAWVLLAAGLFELLYFAAVALLELLIAGPNSVLPQLQALIATKFAVFAWLPVLFFFLFFELTVLLFNRAGRFAYVVASLVVAVIVYVLSAVLIPLVIAGAPADRNTAIQAFLSPAFILVGLVAREVMLWTGIAIGARGTRVRRRNKEARRQYKQELADAGA